ncbi:hypothetical protein D9V84_02595 [Bacteroidetes/Chlorobi group bacterium Naka2016]|jgi:translation initiation factor 2B subunit (eIF-2B alpha/beta/delta family)|nr:MAG: hypothetical protein D9V84_02595 [Bacteroidetes/Chlorobi group bacterium Naka2016]
MNCDNAKRNLVASIANDFINGSMTITQNALEGLLHIIKICPNISQNEFFELLDEIKKAKPTMQALRNILEIIENKIVTNRSKTIERILFETIQDLQRAKEWTISKAMRFVLTNFRNRELSILTTSYSSTINKFLENLANLKKIQLWVFKSQFREFDYSNQTFKKALDLGMHSQVVEEAQLINYSSKIDFALSGADCISLGGGIVNGTPTLSMAQFCSRHKIPYFVIAESIKFGNDCIIEDGFDLIPMNLVSGIFTDGVFTQEQGIID